MPNHFQLLERVGVGAFGAVWKAHDKDLDRTVAVKVPRDGRFDTRDAKRFLQEARTASQLKHPNIVSVHEVGRYREGVYIVAEYVAGQTLAEWLKQQRPTGREAAEICRVIAEAVHYAHEAGVIHRDLKPANIIVDTSGDPHITDFGLARRTTEEVTVTADGQIQGTPAYMSPEQVQANSQHIDHRTDVYALGVILFELLTGERPFRGSMQMLLHQVVETEAPRTRELNCGISRDLENICVKCLEKDPRRRYQSAKLLAEDLEHFVKSEPVTARPIPVHVRVWRWCMRNRLATALAAGLFLVPLFGLAATTSQWFRAEGAAAREAETRSEIETLTRHLLQVVERLQNLEESQPTLGRLESSAFQSAEFRKDADPHRAYSRPTKAAKLAGRLHESGEIQPMAKSSTLGSTGAAKGNRSSLGYPRPREASELAGLRTEAKATFQRLEQLSPTVAQSCRGAFPELVGD